MVFFLCVPWPNNGQIAKNIADIPMMGWPRLPIFVPCFDKKHVWCTIRFYPAESKILMTTIISINIDELQTITPKIQKEMVLYYIYTSIYIYVYMYVFIYIYILEWYGLIEQKLLGFDPICVKSCQKLELIQIMDLWSWHISMNSPWNLDQISMKSY